MAMNFLSFLGFHLKILFHFKSKNFNDQKVYLHNESMFHPNRGPKYISFKHIIDLKWVNLSVADKAQLQLEDLHQIYRYSNCIFFLNLYFIVKYHHFHLILNNTHQFISLILFQINLDTKIYISFSYFDLILVTQLLQFIDLDLHQKLYYNWIFKITKL
jgi:hypothetical protein